MQRLTKYSLLLKAIHKKTDCEDQRLGLEIMVSKLKVAYGYPIAVGIPKCVDATFPVRNK